MRIMAMTAIVAAAASLGCLPDGDGEPSEVGATVETQAALLPPGGGGEGPQPCPPLCGACVADANAATGCSKPCRTNTCAFTTRAECPASACPPPACAPGLTMTDI